VDLGSGAGVDADHGMVWGRGKLAFLGYSLWVHGCFCVAHLDTERQGERERWREMFKNSLGRFSVAGRTHTFGGK
jgi:hypothetical protein